MKIIENFWTIYREKGKETYRGEVLNADVLDLKKGKTKRKKLQKKKKKMEEEEKPWQKKNKWRSNSNIGQLQLNGPMIFFYI